MAICQYFLRGTCKYGDRCYNEHRRPESRDSYNRGYHNKGRGAFSGSGGQHGHNGPYGGNRGGGNRGGGNRRGGYRGGGYRGGGYHGGGYHGGGGHSGHDDYYDDYYDDDQDGGYHGHRGHYGGHGGGHSGYDNYYSGDRGGERGGGRNSHFGGSHGDGYGGHDSNYRGGQGGGNFGRNRYESKNSGNHNRYAALSHQPDPEFPSFGQKSQPRVRTDSSSQHSLSTDQKLESIRKDVEGWNKSGQWPLSCYAMTPSEPCFEGLLDISPEEVRDEAYKANATGKAAAYVQSFQQTMERYNNRKRELANMSVISLRQEMSRSSQQNTATPGLFGDVTSSASLFGSNQTSLFGNSAPASGGLFGSSAPSVPGSGPFSSSSFAPSTLPATSPTSSGPFGSTSSSAFSGQASTSLFGTKETNPTAPEEPSQTTTSSATVAPLLRCSEQDMKAFKGDQFVLGAIPECPPPPELC